MHNNSSKVVIAKELSTHSLQTTLAIKWLGKQHSNRKCFITEPIDLSRKS
jgi:hypothetical protein